MFLDKFDKDKRIELQQKEIEKLIVENQALHARVSVLEASISEEHNKANLEYEKAKQLAASLEVTRQEYEKLMIDLRECREKYKSQIAQVKELQKKYSKEYKKAQREDKKLNK